LPQIWIRTGRRRMMMRRLRQLGTHNLRQCAWRKSRVTAKRGEKGVYPGGVIEEAGA